MLSKNDKTHLLKKIPTIKLFYEPIVHKKVTADYYILIPKGKLTYIWFTQFKNKNIALQLIANYNGDIIDIKPLVLSFNNNISINTLIYGVNINYKNNELFIIKDIIWYKNICYHNQEFIDKIHLYNIFFNNIKNTNISSIKIYLPVITNNYNNIVEMMYTLPYKTNHIEFYKNTFIGKYFIKDILKANFIIKASLHDDIYDLFCINKYGEEEKYDIAFIPSYKKSVQMNAIFRNIRENINLDSLEESDDDEMFENITETKFIHVSIKKTMECIYVSRFKKWLPLTIVNSNDIISYNKLLNLSL